ncbi:MAG: LON peptidase substrate-binding domain-containing protein [Pirellulales bacterium]
MDFTLPSQPVPMFPLPRVFLFPHQLLPLHVFEPRYRRMVEDQLDGAGRLVLATIPDGEAETPEHQPAVHDVAGLGEIVRHERQADGRFMIWVMGLCRVRVHEVASDRPYRRVQCEPFPEIDATEAEAELPRKLRVALAARLQQPVELPESAPVALLADLLLQALRPPAGTMARVFAEPSIARRARLVLGLARESPPPA